MASFKLYSKTQTFFGEAGEVLAGGYLKFYEAGSLTPQAVFGNKALTTNNGSQVALDASGRLTLAVWGDTANGYFVEWYDADDVKQGDEDDVEAPGGAGQTLPTLNPGEYLSGDGSGNFLAVDLSTTLLPDMTGHSNEILTTDGETASWGARPADGAAGTSDIVIGTKSLKVSNGTSHILEQWDTGTVAGGGGLEVSTSVTFPTAYSSAPDVDVTVEGSNASAAGNVEVKPRVTSVTTTGFNVTFSARSGGSSADLSGNCNLSGTVSYGWRAKGPTAS